MYTRDIYLCVVCIDIYIYIVQYMIMYVYEPTMCSKIQVNHISFEK